MIKRVDLMDNTSADGVPKLWQELISELQTNNTVMVDVIGSIMQDGYDVCPLGHEDDDDWRPGFDIAHSTMLVHMGQFFFDSIHAEERLTFKESGNFLRFLQ